MADGATTGSKRTPSRDRLLLLEGLIDAWPTPLLLFDDDLRIVEVNRAAADLLQAPAMHIVGSGIEQMSAVFGNATADRRLAMLRSVFETGDASLATDRFLGRAYQSRAVPIVVGGVVSHVALYVTDTTESDRLESHLHEAQAVAKVGSFEGSATSTAALWSEQMCKLMGVASDGPLQMNFQKFLDRVHPEDRGRVRHSREHAAHGGARLHERVRIVRTDGEVRHVELRAKYEPAIDGDVRVFGTLLDVTDQVSAAAALASAETQFQSLANSMNAVLFLIASDGSELAYVNRSVETMLGISVEQLRRDPASWLCAVHPDDRDRVRDGLGSAPDPVDMEYRVLHPSGETSWIHTEGTYTTIDDKVFLAGIARDITQRKLTEDALEQSLKVNESLYATAPIGLCCFDMDLRYLHINEWLAKRNGLPVKHHLGRHITDIIPEATAARAEAELRRVLESHKPVVRLMVHAETAAHPGVRRAYEHTYLPHRIDGELRGVFCVVEDVTARRELEDVWRAVLTDSSDAIICVDESGLITLFSPGAEKMFGHRIEDIMGKRPSVLMHPADGKRHEEALAQFPRNRQRRMQPRELDARCADGSVIPIELALSETRTGFVAIIRNISARRAADAEKSRFAQRAQQREKLEALGTLASGIAHDFNNLLTPIMTYAFLLRGEESVEQRNEMLDAVRQSAQRGAELVRQILAFGRKSEGSAAPVDVVRLVRETAKMLRASLPSNIDIQVTASGTHWTIGDVGQLQTALLNLGVNANQAMPTGGVLRFSLGQHLFDATEAATEDLTPGTFIAVAVTDNGTGIDDAVVGRIFEPFFTTKPVGEGTGMGLASAHGIFRNHGGALAVTTRVGEGTTFTAYVPSCEAPSPISDVHSERLNEVRTIRVMIVDDDDAVLTATTRLLQRAGLHASAFASSDRALAALADTPQAFDAALVDYDMPERNGIQTSRMLRALKPSLAIVLTTGMATGTIEVDVRGMNLVGPIGKPSSPAVVLDAIECAIAGDPWPPNSN